MKFPDTRLRRNRQHSWLRETVAEVSLLPKHLILPLFVIEGKEKKEPVASMPGVERLSMDLIKSRVLEAKALGIKSVILFPVVDQQLKNDAAEEAYNENNLICRTIRFLKSSIDGIGIMCDVALDPYTIHGHDGLLKDGYVANDETLEVLCKQSLALAKAGCDMVAPSDMMDGRIQAIRKALDSAGFQHVGILAYSAKYASSFYGPFRDAVGSKANLGKADKRTYQLDPHNSNEALREIQMDIDEGADIVMVKPALPYLDIIRRAYKRFNIPIFAYQVSGEYSMIKAAADNNWLDFEQTMLESLISIKRAGASSILTYAAMEVATLLCRDRL